MSTLSDINDRAMHTLLFGTVLVLSTVQFNVAGPSSAVELANALATFGGVGFVLSLVRLGFAVGDVMRDAVAKVATADAADYADSAVSVCLAAILVSGYPAFASVSHYYAETVATLQIMRAVAVVVFLIVALVTMPPVKNRLSNTPVPGVAS